MSLSNYAHKHHYIVSDHNYLSVSWAPDAASEIYLQLKGTLYEILAMSLYNKVIAII